MFLIKNTVNYILESVIRLGLKIIGNESNKLLNGINYLEDSMKRIILFMYLTTLSCLVQAGEVSDQPSVGYNASAIWYYRLDAIEALNSKHLTEEQKASLKIIAARDPDWRIRRAAAILLE
jgi:hypothetical protein